MNFKQLNLIDQPGILANGQNVKVGDVVKASYYMYTTITKVFEEDGCLAVVGPGAYCFNVKIMSLLESGVTVEKVTPTEVYKFCKKNQWNTEKYLRLFK